MNQVKKLDTELFNLISTGHQSRLGLERNTVNAYNSWFHALKDKLHLKNIDNISWVGNHYADIIAYIMNNPNIKSKNSIRNHLENLGRTLLAIDKNKFKEDVRPLFLKGKELSKKIKKEYRNNQLTSSELNNYVSFEQLDRKRHELFNKWNDDLTNHKLNIEHLILALNTLIPPLRLTYIQTPSTNATEFWLKRTEPPKNNTNYMWERFPNHWFFVLNHDKLTSHYKNNPNYQRPIFDIKENLPGMLGKGELLNAILTTSLQAYPRKYLLTSSITNEPLSVTSYSLLLHQLFFPKIPTQNIIRKAFVNEFYNRNLSQNQLDLIAIRMRHDINSARDIYYKVNIHHSLS